MPFAPSIFLLLDLRALCLEDKPKSHGEPKRECLKDNLMS